MRVPVIPQPIHAVLLALLVACGLQGGTPIFNDAAPTCCVVAQGSFVGNLIPGKAVNGIAAVYADQKTLTYIIRLEGLTAPNEVGLTVVGMAGGTQVYNGQLRGISGNQNYPTGIPTTPSKTWNSIAIHNPAYPTGAQDYGKAVMQY